MAAIDAIEKLTLEEYTALREMMQAAVIRSALLKVFAFDEKFHAETLENESLSAGQVSVTKIIQAACMKRSAREAYKNILHRAEQLKPTQNQPQQ